MASRKKKCCSLDEVAVALVAVAAEICTSSNKPRKYCCCHLCLSLLSCGHRKKHLPPQTGNPKAPNKDKDNGHVLVSLPHSSSQPTECEITWENTPDDLWHNQRSQKHNPPHRSRLRVVRRSKSLEDFRSRSPTEDVDIPYFRELLQSTEKRNSRHSSSGQLPNLQTFSTKSKGDSASVSSDSNETLPDPIKKEDDEALSKSVQNVQSPKQMDVSIEIKKEVISDEEDNYSEALFNYSQEDEVILIYDSDEGEDSQSPETSSKNADEEIPPSGRAINNLRDADTQPCFDLDLDADTQPCFDLDLDLEDQPQKQSRWNNVQTEKTGATLKPCEKQEVPPLLSKSPKFTKNRSVNLTRGGSLRDCQMLSVKDIKREEKSDSDGSDDLFDSQATQLYSQTEWEHVDTQTEEAEQKKSDSIKAIQEQNQSSPSDDDDDDGGGGGGGGLADDGNQGVRINKEATTEEEDDDDDDDDGDFFCATQIDTPSDSAKLKKRKTREERSKTKPVTRSIDDDVDDADDADDDDFFCATQIDTPSDSAKLKKRKTMEEKSKTKPVTRSIDDDVDDDDDKGSRRNRWKTTSKFYDEVESDDDLFWCATQVDSTTSDEKRKPMHRDKEPFVLVDSEEEDDDDSTYMMATQIDMELELSSSRRSQSNNTFKLPALFSPQATKVSKKTHKNLNESWLHHTSVFPEEDSDSDESMFSVATQLDDPHALNEDTGQMHNSAKASTSQTSRLLQNAKKRKLKKHKRGSSYRSLRDLHETVDNSDSDDSIFSLATQVDNDHDDDDDDSLFMAATQVDREPSTRSFKVPLSLKKRKMKPKAGSQNLKSFLKADDDCDSDDSVYSIATQVDSESPSTNKMAKLTLRNLKYQNKSTLKSLYITDENYDSDSSVFSMATQVDAPSYKRKGEKKDDTINCKKKVDKKDEDEDDDIAYLAATQVDTDADGPVKKPKPRITLLDDIFKVPSFPSKKKIRIVPPSQIYSKATSSGHKQSKGPEPAANSESAKEKQPFTNFLFGIAESEMENTIVVISPEKKEDTNSSGEPKKGFGQFLLDLSEDEQAAQDQSKLTPKPISQTCPVEPLWLKTRKEMRDSFKNQPIRGLSDPVKNQPIRGLSDPIKIVGPDKKSIQKSDPKVSPTNDAWLSKSKIKPVPKKTKLKESISENINEARNQLEERNFLSHLDNSRVGWNKASHIQYGSSSTITDVQLPDEVEIRRKGLPLTEGPQRRRPLPETPIDHLPHEKEVDSQDPTDSVEQRKSPVSTGTGTGTGTGTSTSTSTSLRKSPGGSVSTRFYRRSGLDTFKIPKLPIPKPKLPSNPVPQYGSDDPQGGSSSKPPQTELINQQLELLQKIIDDKVIMSRQTLKDPRSSNSGCNSRPPAKRIFTRWDSTISVPKKNTNNYPSRPAAAAAQTSSFASRTQHLQNRRAKLKNIRDLILQHILKWNPKWLTEQKNMKTTPPIVKMDELLPLLNSYSSLEDYQSIFRPLLLLEIWEGISKEFSENRSNHREWQVGFSNVQPLNSFLMDYIVYGVISIQDYSNKKQMMEGDLVKMNLQVEIPPQSSSTNTEGIQQNTSYPVIGVVESIRFYDPQLHSEILTRFPRLASLPEVRSKFKVYRAIIKTHYRKLNHAFTDLMSLELISSLTSHLRQFQALMSLSSSPLCPYILNPGRGEGGSAAASGVDIPSTKSYNSSQMKAITAASFIVRRPSDQPYYCLIQGPPGTGKSHTIIGIIQKIKQINENCKVLLCAPSNGAIDELTRRLIKERHIARVASRKPLKVVRIGNPDNIHEDVASYTLSELIKSNARAEIKNCASVYPELKRVCANEKKIILKLKDPALHEKNHTAEEQKRKLVKDLRNLQENKKFLTRQFQLAESASEAPSLSHKQESELRHTILSKADVICSTLNTCGSSLYLNDLNVRPFDCIIIDEASQCTELDSLIPLQYNCCKLILVGDTEQLAPTVLSQRAAEYNYGQSLFERLCNHFKDLEETTSNPVIMLNCQYRMHPEICKFSSRYIYDNKLLSDTNLELRIPPINIVPYLMFDLQHGQQIRSADTGSLSNPKEAEFTVDLCEHLLGLNGNKSPLAIGIIAPYKLQKNLLRQLLTQRKIYKIEVTTVDGFQGREKDIIIMSCVRAQGSGGRIGFLTNRKRLNVALTRAKFALYMVGHLQSLEHADEDWKSLIQDAHQRKLVVPVNGGGGGGSVKLALQKCEKKS